jgi:lysozyme
MPPPYTPLDPLPVPEEAPVQAQPAQIQAMAGQPLPPSAGWVSPAGAGAYIASNLLTGWMAGKHVAEQRKLEKARTQVQGAKSVFDAMNQQYQDMVAQGLVPTQMDPTQPLSQKQVEQRAKQDPAQTARIDQAKKNVNTAWQSYLAVAQQYAFPEGGEKKGIKGFGQRVGREFTAQQPEMFAQASLNVLKGMDPTSAAFTSPEIMERQLMGLKIQEAQNTLAQQKQQADITAKQVDLETQLVDAIEKGDTARQDKLRDELTAMGISEPEPITAAERELKRKEVQAKLKVSEILSQPGGDLSQVDEGTRLLAGLGPTQPAEWYIKRAGGVGHEIEGYEAFLKANALDKLAGREPTAVEEVKAAIRGKLAYQLQDPAFARSKGLTAPLRPGQAVPDHLVDEEFLEREKPTAEEKKALAVATDKNISDLINRVATAWPNEDEKKALNLPDGMIQYDPELRQWMIRPDRPAEVHNIFSRNTVGGVAGGNGKSAQENYDDLKNRLIEKVTSLWMWQHPGADPDRFRRAIGSGDAGGYLIRQSDEEKGEAAPAGAGPAGAGLVIPTAGSPEDARTNFTDANARQLFQDTTRREGFKAQAYYDRDAGQWSIGYGRSGNVQPGDTSNEYSEAEWTRERLGNIVRDIQGMVTVPINEAQLRSLASLAYNLRGGTDTLRNSGLIATLNAGDYEGAGKKFKEYTTATDANGVKHQVPALVTRRAEEAVPFLPGGQQPAEQTATQPVTAQGATPQPAAKPTAQTAPPPGGKPADVYSGIAALQPPPKAGTPGGPPIQYPTVKIGGATVGPAPWVMSAAEKMYGWLNPPGARTAETTQQAGTREYIVQDAKGARTKMVLSPDDVNFLRSIGYRVDENVGTSSRLAGPVGMTR